MWEVYSEGRLPYENYSNSEVVDSLNSGLRLLKPRLAPETVHIVMEWCWKEVSAGLNCVPCWRAVSIRKLKKKKRIAGLCMTCLLSLYACFDRSQKSGRPLLSCCMSSAAWQMRAARERKKPKTKKLYLIYLWICKHKWCVYYLWICIELDDLKAQYLSSSMACV